MTQDIQTEFTDETVVTSAQFRDFYENHWPKTWYVEEMPLEAENELGEWVLPDTERRPLKDPKTANGSKTSKRGRQGAVLEKGALVAARADDLPDGTDALRMVFLSGDIVAPETFEGIRARAWPGVPGFDPAA